MDTTKILRELLGRNATKSRRIQDMRRGDDGGKRMGKTLEDLLGVHDEDEEPRPTPRRTPQRRQPAPERRAEPEPQPKRGSGGLLDDLLGGLLGGGKPAQRQPERRREPEPEPKPERRSRPELVPRKRSSRNDQHQAVFLIRAMCNAAKVDGDIDRAEQDAILDRLGDVTEEELDFVRQQLASPLNVTLFCRSVPEEMAEQVYGFSVMAIQLDTLREAAYLGRLAQGLRLDPKVCDRLHDKVGAPHLFC